MQTKNGPFLFLFCIKATLFIDLRALHYFSYTSSYPKGQEIMHGHSYRMEILSGCEFKLFGL